MHFIRLLKKQYFDMKLRYKRGKRNMWKKVYLTILSIITVGAIIIGSMIHFGGFRFGSWEFSGNEAYGSPFRTVLTEEKQELEAFEKVRITAEMSGVTLKTGDSYCIAARYDKNDEITYEIDDGMLKVNERKKRVFRFFPFFQNIRGGTITITVPKDKMLESIDLKLDMGSITITDLKMDKTKVQADMGSITAENCELGDASLETEMGSVKADRCGFTSLSAESEMGSIDINVNGSVQEMDLDLSTEMGSVTVDGEKVTKNFEQTGNGGKSIKAETEMGSIKIKSR